MSTLTYADRDTVATEAAEAKPARRPFLARLWEGILDSQHRRAEREIARYLATRGILTDEVEREMMRRLSGVRAL
jgi:hypothetical protein